MQSRQTFFVMIFLNVETGYLQGASVLYVARLLATPVILLKVVTDIVDGDRPTSEEFLANLSTASLVLLETATRMLNFIRGKSIKDL